MCPTHLINKQSTEEGPELILGLCILILLPQQPVIKWKTEPNIQGAHPSPTVWASPLKRCGGNAIYEIDFSPPLLLHFTIFDHQAGKHK